MNLILTPNLADPDGVYEKLIALHEGRDEADSHRINARLILILINHIGDRETILEAIEVAGGDA
ncbi:MULTISPECIES: DUF2783 domain-containing protein [unclassified Sphingomonas]|uniref:DUF2783 domain-containing protein n=1 Tax=unclassified Sphingomonas TaxID=196159 RepID=UPI0006F32F15|nr:MULTISPECIES: DUF2783 domain-containing protein [unclassified Sphingomonas]KQX26049.1 hypothetical protein ASD17_00855 [Sphingomonas sp. Root1294]KQY69115.1 hypothetical protein ASD39_02050 [Sphingomonas sp. Root50]KRB89370.1 hypothetical protein ASE22_16965 [Sphingomonas sp. Root720]